MDFRDKPFIPRNENWEFFFSFLYGIWFIVSNAFLPFILTFIPSYLLGYLIRRIKKPWSTYLVGALLVPILSLCLFALLMNRPKTPDTYHTLYLTGLLMGVYFGIPY